MGRRRPHLTRPPTQPGGLNLEDPFVASLGLIQLSYGGMNWDFAAEQPYVNQVVPTDRAETTEYPSLNSARYRLAKQSEKTQSFTVGLQVRLLGASTGYAPLIGLMYDTAGSAPYGDQIDMSGDSIQRVRFAFNAGGNALSIGGNGPGISSTSYDWIWVTFTSGSQALYINGVLIAQSSTVGALSFTATSTIGFGAMNADGRNPNVSIKVGLRSNRVLSASEMREIEGNANRLARNPKRTAILGRVATGPTYTFAGSVGNFALSGVATRLIVARRIVGAAGSILSSAGNAALVARRRLPAAVASYVLAGAATGLSAARSLQGGSMAVQLTGAGAALKAVRVLPVAAGAVALAGASAKLAATRKLTAQTAGLSFTGGAVTFVYTSAPGGQGPTYTLTGGSAAFMLTPMAARLVLARRLVVGVGAFSVTGAPASIVAGRRLPAAAGAVSVAGSSAGLRAARRLPAAAASFLLTGASATLYYTTIAAPGGPTYTLAAVGGALGLTGTGVGLLTRRRLSGGTGQLSLTGSDATLSAGQKIEYARAPAGSGYTPRTAESQHRPGSAAMARPGATQRNKR